MRRKGREIIDPKILESIINKANVCRLAMCEGGVPYIIPLCFGYEKSTLYFHSAIEGRKLEILRKSARVCFEMDVDSELVKTGDRCTMKYRSVIGFGNASFIETSEDKRKALDLIMKHYHQEPIPYPEPVLAMLSVVKVEIEDMTGKASI
jgi:hypothetical protein